MLGISGTTVRLHREGAPAATFINAVVTQVDNAATGRSRAILNPNGNLGANTQYTVILTGGATQLRDLSGNPLVSVTRTFTTGAN